MRFIGRMVGITAILGLCTTVGFAQQVSDDFESYAVGTTLAGQGNWSVVSAGHNEIVSDNGPSAAGSKAVSLKSGADGTEVAIRLDWAAIGDLVAAYGPYVTMQYDIKVPTNANYQRMDVRLMDDQLGRPAVWNTHFDGGPGLACQTSGGLYPGDTVGGWHAQGDPGWSDTDWHTVALTFHYAGSAPNLVKVTFDGTEYIRDGAYFLAPNADSADWLFVRVRGNYDGGQLEDNLILDNVQIFAGPAPSAAPTAVCGPDQNLAGSWDGTVIDLDGSASTDDVGIANYRWQIGAGVLSSGPDAMQQSLIDPGTHTIIQVAIDEDNLYSADTFQAIVSDPPIIDDNVQVQGGIYLGDIYGTNVSDAPVTFDENTTWTVINERTADADGPAYTSDILFDLAGNLYVNEWNSRIASYTPDLVKRWETEPVGDVGEGNASMIVGERYVYVANRGNYDPDPNTPGDEYYAPYIKAFTKVTGAVAWQAPLLVAGSVVEDNSYTPRMTLYEDRLYVLGETGKEMSGQCRVYVVSATDGSAIASSLVDTGMAAIDNDPGNLVLVPNLLDGGTMHGLFWNQRSTGDTGLNDGTPDVGGVKIDPTTGVATAHWTGAGDGPQLWRGHLSYAATNGMIYGVSYWDSPLDTSMFAYDALTAASPLMYTVPRADGGNHGGADATFIDEFTPGEVKVHTHSQGEPAIYTFYEDPNGMVVTEKRVFDMPSGSWYVSTGKLLNDVDNGRSVAVVAVETKPVRIVGLDLTAPPEEPDDGAVYVDDIKIYATNDLNGTWDEIYSYSFDNLTVGPIHGQPYGAGYAAGAWNAVSTQYDPDNQVPPQVVDSLPGGRPGKAVLQDPFGVEGSTWFDGWPFEYGAFPFDVDANNPFIGYQYVVFEWYEYREDLTDQVRQYTSYNIGSAYALDDGTGTYSALGVDGPYAIGQAGVWNKVQRVFDFGLGIEMNVRILVNDAEVDPNAPAATANVSAQDYLDFSVDATVNSSTPLPGPIVEWVDPMYDPNTGDWFWYGRGPAVGPDGSVYGFLGYVYDRRLVRIGPAECRGDTNCDGQIDFDDINPFVEALTIVPPSYCDGTGANADVNGDGEVDFDDINPFVILLTTNPVPIACPGP